MEISPLNLGNGTEKISIPFKRSNQRQSEVEHKLNQIKSELIQLPSNRNLTSLQASTRVAMAEGAFNSGDFYGAEQILQDVRKFLRHVSSELQKTVSKEDFLKIKDS